MPLGSGITRVFTRLLEVPLGDKDTNLYNCEQFVARFSSSGPTECWGRLICCSSKSSATSGQSIILALFVALHITRSNFGDRHFTRAVANAATVYGWCRGNFCDGMDVVVLCIWGVDFLDSRCADISLGYRRVAAPSPKRCAHRSTRKNGTR